MGAEASGEVLGERQGVTFGGVGGARVRRERVWHGFERVVQVEWCGSFVANEGRGVVGDEMMNEGEGDDDSAQGVQGAYEEEGEKE